MVTLKPMHGEEKFSWKINGKSPIQKNQRSQIPTLDIINSWDLKYIL